MRRLTFYFHFHMNLNELEGTDIIFFIFPILFGSLPITWQSSKWSLSFSIFLSSHFIFPFQYVIIFIIFHASMFIHCSTLWFLHTSFIGLSKYSNRSVSIPFLNQMSNLSMYLLSYRISYYISINFRELLTNIFQSILQVYVSVFLKN